jgi:glycosyltransferase involved in cell wall biosynthesis
LIVTSYAPDRSTGRGVRTCGVIAALARHGTVEVAYVPAGGGEPAPDLATTQNVSLKRIEPSRGAARLLAGLRSVAKGAPWSLAKAASPELVAAARQAPADARLIADGPTAAAAVILLRRHRDAVFLAHNLESAFRGGGALRRFERRVLRGFGEAWMATHADMEAARELAGRDIRTRYAPNVVDLALLPEPGARPGNQVALLVGDFTYVPNREGLDYLAGQVMPRVWAELPDATVNVVGRGVHAPPADPRVRVLGFVDSLDGAYADADAVVVPLLHGGGSPLKFVEALARGVPVVATSHAAGLIENGVPSEHFLAAGDADAFAAALVSVLRGGADDLGRRGRELAAEHLSVDALARELGA